MREAKGDGRLAEISPADDLFAVFMIQAPEYREYLRVLFRTLVNAAVG